MGIKLQKIMCILIYVEDRYRILIRENDVIDNREIVNNNLFRPFRGL